MDRWCNLSGMDIQPSFALSDVMLKNDPQVRCWWNLFAKCTTSLFAIVLCKLFQSAIQLHSAVVDTTLAYNNGGSLKLEGSIRCSESISKPAIAR